MSATEGAARRARALGTLPLLPSMGVGSCAAPGWFIAMMRMLRAGELGPLDAEELLADAARCVVDDQREAGLDILSDGELRRQRFVYELYQHLEGLERKPVPRRLGVTGYDVAPAFHAVSRVSAPRGLGLVEEFRTVTALAGPQPVKIALPGPLTFLGALEPRGVSQSALIDDVVTTVSEELLAVAAAGARYLQLDEPMLTHLPLGLSEREGVELINRSLAPLDAYTAVHVCFGNNAGRPMADRRLARLLEAMNRIACDELVLEFANREMAELSVLGALRPELHLAAGLVDVKSFHVESPERVAERVRQCLEHVEPERLTVTADCGFSALPRHVARQKLEALAAGARWVRRELAPGT